MFPHSSRGQNYFIICNREEAACAQPLAQQCSRSSVSCSLGLGVTVVDHRSFPAGHRNRSQIPSRTDPSLQGSNSPSTLLLVFLPHWGALARWGVRDPVVVSCLLPLSRPFNRDTKELFNSMGTAQHSLQGAVCVLISFQLPSLQ